MDPAAELHSAVRAKDAAPVRQLLDAAADPAALAAARDAQGRHTLHWLAVEPSHQEDLDDIMNLLGLGGDSTPKHDRPSAKQVEIVRLLAAACPALVAQPISSTTERYSALHWAAHHGWHEVVGPLLEAAPSAALTPAPSDGKLPLHLAARGEHAAAAELLLRAAPSAVTVTDHLGCTPLEAFVEAQPAWDADIGGGEDLFRVLLGASSQPQVQGSLLAQPAGPDSPGSSRCPFGLCLIYPHAQLVRMLLDVPGQDPSRLLQSLSRCPYDMRQYMADVAARYPLTPADWQLIPSPCPSLAAALPAVLQRSEVEAALLVARLPDTERSHLRTAVLCLHRAQAEACVALPQPLVWRILTDSLGH